MREKIVIIGRTNTGKSTLFNRLVGEKYALVHDMPGTTRDRKESLVKWKDKEFVLVDTGGWANDAKEPVSLQDGKITLPSKHKVLSSMEELIHQFMLVTEGVNCPPGEVYFGHENPKGELGF